MYSFIAQTLPGTKKKINEDRIFINGHILADGEYSGVADTITAVVCDGIGGEHGGDCAASIATSGCLSISGLHINGNDYCSFNMGDTRAYLYAAGELTMLSVDHTVAAQMLKSGEISSMAEAKKIETNTLTRYLGGYGTAGRPTIRNGEIKEGNSLFVICSDGIYKSFQDISDFQTILNSKSDLMSKKEAIVQRALHNGSSDDKSLIIISKL